MNDHTRSNMGKRKGHLVSGTKVDFKKDLRTSSATKHTSGWGFLHHLLKNKWIVQTPLQNQNITPQSRSRIMYPWRIELARVKGIPSAELYRNARNTIMSATLGSHFLEIVQLELPNSKHDLAQRSYGISYLKFPAVKLIWFPTPLLTFSFPWHFLPGLNHPRPR